MRAARWLMAGLACLLALPASGAEPDKRVAKALQKARIPFSIDADGDFEVIVTLGARTHKVWISSGVGRFQDAEVRDVFAYAHVVEDDFGSLPDELYPALLERHYKIGAWITQSHRAAVFSAAIDAAAKPNVLRSAIYAVAESADDLERELTGDADRL